MKKYAANFVKNRLPLFIIIFAVLVIVGVATAASLDFIEKVYYFQNSTRPYEVAFPEDAGVMGLALVACIAAAILPIFNMSSHYSLAKRDLYRQTAKNKNSYRYVDHGITLGFLLASYTVAFLIFIIIVAIKNQVQPIPEDSVNVSYYRIYYNLSQYFYVYVLTFIFIIGNYFINYLFVSRSNNLLNSIILMVLGQLFMGFFPVLFAEFEGPVLRFFMHTPLCNSSASFGPLFLDYRYTSWIIRGDSSYMVKFESNYDSVTLSQAIRFTTYSFVTFFSVAILGIIAFFFEKDPSSEWAGKPETKKPYQEICYNLFIGAMFTVFIYWIIKEWNESSMMQLVFWFVFYLVVYYVLYGVIKRNFKPKLYQIIVMVSNTALLVIVGFIIFGCIGFTPVEY